MSQMGPIADSRTAAKAPLFDNLVGTGEKRWRHCQAERLGGLEVHGHLKFCRELRKRTFGSSLEQRVEHSVPLVGQGPLGRR